MVDIHRNTQASTKINFKKRRKEGRKEKKERKKEKEEEKEKENELPQGWQFLLGYALKKNDQEDRNILANQCSQ